MSEHNKVLDSVANCPSRANGAYDTQPVPLRRGNRPV